MCQDIINLCCSYLLINNIFKVSKKYRNDIIKIYKLQIPSIEIACKDGYLEIVKYWFRNGITSSTHITDSDYLFDDNIVYILSTIDSAAKNGHLEVVKFLLQNGVQVSHNTIEHTCK